MPDRCQGITYIPRKRLPIPRRLCEICLKWIEVPAAKNQRVHAGDCLAEHERRTRERFREREKQRRVMGRWPNA